MSDEDGRRASVLIRAFQPADQEAVLDLVLSIQRQEFKIEITAEDQPDLRSVPESYQSGAGGFWIATIDQNILGTIGLKDIGNRQAALRKMFVAAAYRGSRLGIAVRLLERLLAEARNNRIGTIFLGTTESFKAAHCFYRKSGFDEIGRYSLPTSFPLMSVDTKFYAFRLST